MVAPLSHWCGLYQQWKSRALCLDIETAGYHKPITVVGLYAPRDGEIEVTQFVRGQNLTAHHLAVAFAGCRLLITFNGISFDVPRIWEEFGEMIPRNIPVLDLYRFARRLNLDTNLKVLETTFGVERLDARTQRRHIAVKLWRRFEEHGDREALIRLLDYNREDCINLYPLAEMLVELAERQASDAATRGHSVTTA